ncbi:DNA repair protein REV1 [Rhodotorula toruloides]|uniref:DNA repair protein REV1 n=1 Tax=Rhodotorula toruloides TaxID=5286 RepID=A0A511KB80_RHOTO|nr:DNA repair protein REV1 [Rhodotorula toruloides]
MTSSSPLATAEGSVDPAFDLALADFDPDTTLASSSLNPAPTADAKARSPQGTKRAAGDDSADYRDQHFYEPVKFGEFGKYMRNKRKKLQVQNKAMLEDGDEKPQIFRGLRVYVNGFTDGLTLPEVIELLVQHGATYVPYLDKKSLVTHIIASNLTPSKRKEFSSYKVVKHEWLVQSVEARKLLDWREFSLLAPSKSAPARTMSPSTAAPGVVSLAAETAARLGIQNGQMSLFSMGVGKGGDAATQAARGRDGQSATANKWRTETIETLSERGARLAKEALNAQASSSINPFFRPRLTADTRDSSRPSSRPTMPKKPHKPVSGEAPDMFPPPERIAANLPATTDSPGKPNAITHSWLPQAERSERTNSLLQDADWLSKHTASSADFLEGYFAQSRLHWISTFKEELKVIIAGKQQGVVRPARKKSLTGRASDGRTIFHVDFDCFFVSAGLTTRPELRGKPVAVCHAKGDADAATSTSEIASCSYEARSCGVKNGMSLGRARELCPDIQTMPFEFDLYRSITLAFYDILLAHSSYLQVVSMDECLMEVDVPPTVFRDQDPAMDLARKLRADILNSTGCQASIGISHNILLARLAMRKAKPASAFHLFPEDVDEFLFPLDVDSLPGIGWSLRDKLKRELNVGTVGDLRRVPSYKLARTIGPENGKKFAAFAQGVDNRELEVGKPRQSVSTEVNYGIRFPPGRDDLVDHFMRRLGAETAKRLRAQGLQARQLTLKVMTRHPDAPIETPKFLGHGYCNVENKVSAIAGRSGGATDDPDIVGETAWKLMRSMQAPAHELRGIGIQLSKLEKDGVPVDVVREKGQSTLSFQPATKKPSTSSAPSACLSRQSAEDQTVPHPTATMTISSSPKETIQQAVDRRNGMDVRAGPALRKEPSTIVLDSDSDADDFVSRPPPPAPRPALGPLRQRTRRTRTADPYIPSMFRPTKKAVAPPPPTASQVTDAELSYYGIDPETYRTLDRDLRIEVLRDARRTKPPPTKEKLEGYARKETTPRMGNKGPPVDDWPVARAPPAVVVLPPSPSELTDTQIAAMQYDPSMFRALGKSTQLEQIEVHEARQKRLVVGDGPKRESTDASGPRSRAPIKDVAIRVPPRFQGKVELSEVLDRIERWVQLAKEDGPDSDDLDALGRYIEKCASRDKGHNLKKATDVLKWWECVLEQAFGQRGTEEVGTTASLWWEGLAQVKERLEWLVLKESRSRLRF